MYGIIGTAVTLGVLLVFIIKKLGLNSMKGDHITFSPTKMSVARYLIGGTIFGLGWAMTGACPGPLFTLLGHGILSILLVIGSAILGTYVYGLLRERLPH